MRDHRWPGRLYWERPVPLYVLYARIHGNEKIDLSPAHSGNALAEAHGVESACAETVYHQLALRPGPLEKAESDVDGGITRAVGDRGIPFGSFREP
jgi:hypothetical protein